MKQRLFVLGAWNVAREFIKKVIDKDWKEFHKNPSEIIGVANSKYMNFDSRWLDINFLEKVSLSAELSKNALSEKTKYSNMDEILEVVNNEWLDGEVIFVDLTAWKDVLLDFHKKVILNSQNSIVTANKNPISLFNIEDFDILTSFHHRYDANTTAMWWAWVVNFINERKEIQDEILNIKWCFSGTLWYILSELEQWKKKFSEIVKTAKEEWYTEPNPWDDLNWLDVARKLLILARYSNHRVSIQDIKIKPLIEERFWKLTWDDFFEALKEKDEYFLNLQKEAEKNNEVLRYVAEMKTENGEIILEVWLKNMPKDSEFWPLVWTANLVVIDTESLNNPVPHVIKSRGAGLAVTADAIRVWIAKLVPKWLERS